MLCVPTGKKNYQFEVTVGLEELTSVPFVNGVMFAKLRILDTRNSKQYSARKPIQNHRVEWNSEHKFSCRLIANMQTNMLEDSSLKVSIRKEIKGGKSYRKMGYVLVNISCFANNGSRACRRRYILDSYNQDKRRQDNSMVQMNFTVCQVFGDPCFRVPEEDTSKCVPYEVISSSGLLMTHTPHHRHHHHDNHSDLLLPDSTEDNIDEIVEDVTVAGAGVVTDDPIVIPNEPDENMACDGGDDLYPVHFYHPYHYHHHQSLPSTESICANNDEYGGSNNSNVLSSLESNNNNNSSNSNMMMMMMRMMNSVEDDPINQFPNYPHTNQQHPIRTGLLSDESDDLVYSDALLATVPKRSARMVHQPPQNIPGYSTCPHPSTASVMAYARQNNTRVSAGATMTQPQRLQHGQQHSFHGHPHYNTTPHQQSIHNTHNSQQLQQSQHQQHRRVFSTSNAPTSKIIPNSMMATATPNNPAAMTTTTTQSSSGYVSSSLQHSRQSSNEFSSSLASSVNAPHATAGIRSAQLGNSQSLDEAAR